MIRATFTSVAVLAALAPATQAAAKPNAATGAAQGIGPSVATLTGSVNPAGTPTTAFFQYGQTAAYGARTPDQAEGNGTGRIAVTARVDALAPGTLYHFRIVAKGSGGAIVRGADHTFRTTAAAPTVVPQPSKLELARATISRASDTIDVLAPITARASGSVALELFAAGQVHRWTAAIDSNDGRIRSVEHIPAAQANLGTGIITIRYAGDPDTRPQVVRLRAANNPAALDARRPTIVNGHLQASGTISSSARGSVRVQLEYFSGGVTTTLEKTAAIANGAWRLDAPLSDVEQAAIAKRRGTVHSYILFTGYLAARMRGEIQSYEVLGTP